MFTESEVYWSPTRNLLGVWKAVQKDEEKLTLAEPGIPWSSTRNLLELARNSLGIDPEFLGLKRKHLAKPTVRATRNLLGLARNFLEQTRNTLVASPEFLGS